MGGTFTKKRNRNGEGGLAQGYKYRTEAAKRIFEHIEVAEKALGSALPKSAIVHHVDENILNNEPTNLVICPDASYHRLLHMRMKAMEACGDPNKRCCIFCKTWDDVDAMKHNKAQYAYFHGVCRNANRRERRAAGKAA